MRCLASDSDVGEVLFLGLFCYELNVWYVYREALLKEGD